MLCLANTDSSYVGGSSDGIVVVDPNFADNETPTGTVDGSNKSFALAHSPNPENSILLYQSNQGAWMLLELGVDFTLSGNAIATEVSPPLNARLKAYYRY